MTFGERLKELREAADLSEAKLADMSGVPFGTVHGYGLDTRKPTFENVVKLARALGVSVEAFAGCVEEEAAPPAKGKAPAGKAPRKRKPSP
jgi:transcriptional regulator with XRE-family HTH domain